jgi:hypothetical protein
MKEHLLTLTPPPQRTKRLQKLKTRKHYEQTTQEE